MARLVRDFDDACKEGNYIVKMEVDKRLPAVTVYDNRSGSDREYYAIFAKVIQKIRKNKDCYVLYI